VDKYEMEADMKIDNKTNDAEKPRTKVDDLANALEAVAGHLIDFIDAADRDQDLTDQNKAIDKARAALAKVGRRLE